MRIACVGSRSVSVVMIIQEFEICKKVVQHSEFLMGPKCEMLLVSCQHSISRQRLVFPLHFFFILFSDSIKIQTMSTVVPIGRGVFGISSALQCYR